MFSSITLWAKVSWFYVLLTLIEYIVDWELVEGMRTESFFQQKTWTEKSRMIRLLFISSTGPFTIDIYVCAFSVASVLSDSLWPHGLPPARFLCPWEFPSKNTELGCHALFQGIFLTQGSNACLLHCRQILYLLSHVGSPIDTCTLYIVKIIYLTLLILPETSFIKL